MQKFLKQYDVSAASFIEREIFKTDSLVKDGEARMMGETVSYWHKPRTPDLL